MALTLNHPTLKEVVVYGFTASIGSTPIAGVARVPWRGIITKLGMVAGATFTTDNTVTCAIALAGTTTFTAITGGVITTTAASSVAGTTGTATPTALNAVNEDDIIRFLPSGSTGSAVPGTFFAVIQMA